MIYLCLYRVKIKRCFQKLLKWCGCGGPNDVVDNSPMIGEHSPSSSNTDTELEIPQSLKNLGCYTLQEIANLIRYGFNDYKNKDVIFAIQFLKEYIHCGYFWVFKSPIFISLPHKTDIWNHKIEPYTGVYLVIGKIENYFCYYRHLICINENQITCIERQIINKKN